MYSGIFLGLILKITSFDLSFSSSLALQNTSLVSRDTLGILYEKNHLQPFFGDSHQNITCPSWAYWHNSARRCTCFGNSYVLSCSLLEGQTAVLNYYCLTYDSTHNETVLGECLYLHNDNNTFFYNISARKVLDLNKDTCGAYNRNGTLCGRCVDGMYLQAYSYDMTCITCVGGWSNVIKYLFIAYGPLTILYAVIILFKINVHSSWLQGLVFIDQFMASPMLVRTGLAYIKVNNYVFAYKSGQIWLTLAGIWNLDFFRLYNLNICFKLKPLEVLSLNFIIALYPMLLITITCILIGVYDRYTRILFLLWRPFGIFLESFRSKWDVQTSSIDVFATFIILSSIKLLGACFDILKPVKVYTVSKDGGSRWAMFYDATVPYFGHEHFPYAIVAILVLLIFVIAPILLLLLYPFKTCQKFLNFFPHRWQIKLHTFVDSFQGCYRNGTEPDSWDCRWFSAVPFILRVVIFGLYACSIGSFSIYCTIVLVLTVILTIIIDPYKPCYMVTFTHFNIFLLVFSVIVVSVIPNSKVILFLIIAVLTGSLTFTYVIMFVLYGIICRWKVFLIQVKKYTF